MQRRSIRAHTNSSINALAALENTDFILTGGGNDGLLKLTHTDGEILSFPKEHSGALNAIDYLDETVVSGGTNDSIVLWDLVRQCKTRKLKTDPVSIVHNEVMDLSLQADMLISCGTNRQLNFHDLKSNSSRPVSICKDANDGLSSLDYCSQSYSVYAGSLDGKVYTYDIRQSQVYIDVTKPKVGGGSHNDSIIDLRAYDKQLLITFESGELQLVNTDTMYTVSQTLVPHNSPTKLTYKVNAILIDDLHHASRRYVVSGSQQKQLNLWRLDENAKAKSLKPWTASSDLLNIVNYTKSANRMVCSSGDGFLHLWDNAL
ncbi:Anaphase-promoting complex subunit 4 WD40 domain-containing protein [[Candida] zeylanoides]